MKRTKKKKNIYIYIYVGARARNNMLGHGPVQGH